MDTISSEGTQETKIFIQIPQQEKQVKFENTER